MYYFAMVYFHVQNAISWVKTAPDSGVRGIRTPGTLLTYTRFPGVGGNGFWMCVEGGSHTKCRKIVLNKLFYASQYEPHLSDLCCLYWRVVVFVLVDWFEDDDAFFR